MNDISRTSTLADIQKHLNETCKANGWDQNSVSEVFLLFSEESGELAKAIRKKTGFKGEKTPAHIDENLQDELADVFNYLLEIANRFNIDLADAYVTKASKNAERSWS